MTDEFKKSTANLKKAVPLMIKNHVAATPQTTRFGIPT